MSNIPPPRVQTLVMLKELSEDGITQGVYCDDLLDIVGTQAHELKTKFPASATSRAEAVRLGALGRRNQLAGSLVSNELIPRIKARAEGMHDKTNGIPKSVIGVEDGTEEAAGDMGKSEFDAAYTNIARPSPSKDQIAKIKAEAPYPELLFVLSLKVVHTAIDAKSGMAQFPWLTLLTDVVAESVSTPVHILKHKLQVPRPTFSSAGSTVVPTPFYMGFPGGHAALCTAMAVVIANLVDQPDLSKPAGALGKLAEEVADRRRLAGLHAEFDNKGGEILGRHMGKWLVERVGKLDGSGVLKFPLWTAVYEMAREELNP